MEDLFEQTASQKKSKYDFVDTRNYLRVLTKKQQADEEVAQFFIAKATQLFGLPSDSIDLSPAQVQLIYNKFAQQKKENTDKE